MTNLEFAFATIITFAVVATITWLITTLVLEGWC